jgi:hypothetical protein
MGIRIFVGYHYGYFIGYWYLMLVVVVVLCRRLCIGYFIICWNWYIVSIYFTSLSSTTSSKQSPIQIPDHHHLQNPLTPHYTAK